MPCLHSNLRISSASPNLLIPSGSLKWAMGSAAGNGVSQLQHGMVAVVATIGLALSTLCSVRHGECSRRRCFGFLRHLLCVRPARVATWSRGQHEYVQANLGTVELCERNQYCTCPCGLRPEPQGCTIYVCVFPCHSANFTVCRVSHDKVVNLYCQLFLQWHAGISPVGSLLSPAHKAW